MWVLQGEVERSAWLWAALGWLLTRAGWLPSGVCMQVRVVTKNAHFLVSLNPGQVLGQKELCWVCITKNLASVFPIAASIHVCSRSAQLHLSLSLPISQCFPQTSLCSGKRMEDPQPGAIPGWPHRHPHTAEMTQCQPHLFELILTNTGSFKMQTGWRRCLAWLLLNQNLIHTFLDSQSSCWCT